MTTPFPSQTETNANYRIETYRFILTDEEEWELTQRLDHLSSAMPEEASLLLKIRMDEEYYFQATLSVQTMSRYYESTQEDFDPLEVFARLEDDILEKISHWGYRHSNGFDRRIA